jgi:hypothetical protein
MGQLNACFVHHESIEHLFFSCPVSRYIWSVFQCASGSPTEPRNCVELAARVINLLGLEKLLSRFFWQLSFDLFGKHEIEHVLIIFFPMIQVRFYSRFSIGLTIEVNCRNKGCTKRYVEALIL